MSTTILPVDERNAILAEADRIENVDCGYTACLRNGHDFTTPPSGWTHQLFLDKFDGGCVELEINYTPGHPPVAAIFMGSDGEMTAAELREMAATYEKLPDLLRKYADLMDAIERTTAVMSGNDKILSYVEFTEMAQAVDLAPSELVRIAQKIRPA